MSTRVSGGLSLRMRHFAEIYDGDAKAAAIKAGYSEKNAKSHGSKLLRHEGVQAVIRAREKARTAGDVAAREERQRYWTTVMRDETRDMKDRLKASEMLGRSEGDFLDRVDNNHKFPSVLPEKVDEETLIFIARGGLRAAVAESKPPAPDGQGGDDDDNGQPTPG